MLCFEKQLWVTHDSTMFSVSFGTMLINSTNTGLLLSLKILYWKPLHGKKNTHTNGTKKKFTNEHIVQQIKH